MRLLLALIGPAVMIGMALPARADGVDDQFLATLRAAGITYSDPGRAIVAGKAVCRLQGQGTRMADIVQKVQDLNPKLQGDSAAKFTAIAANSYCPAVLGTGPAPDDVG